MRSKRARWARRVAGWRRSGLTARQYAESVGVNANTLQYWSWRLKSEREAMGEAGAGSTPAVSSLIEVVGSTSIETRFALELRCGLRVCRREDREDRGR